MSYGKLTEQEQYWKQQVDEMLRRASEVDEEGRGGQHRTNALPVELAGAQSRLKRLEQASTNWNKRRCSDWKRQNGGGPAVGNAAARAREKSRGSTRRNATSRGSGITGRYKTRLAPHEPRISPTLIRAGCMTTD